MTAYAVRDFIGGHQEAGTSPAASGEVLRRMSATSLAAMLKDGRISASMEIETALTLKPGEVYSTPRSFVAVHSGDYYEPLEMWSRAIQRQSSWSIAKATPQSYEANWCGWGYDRTVTADESYVRESILMPQAKLVLGYKPLMPTFQGLVSEENVLALVEYVKSLQASGGGGAISSAQPASAAPETRENR